MPVALTLWGLNDLCLPVHRAEVLLLGGEAPSPIEGRYPERTLDLGCLLHAAVQVVESVRKLSLSSLMVFILPGTAIQIVLAVLLDRYAL